MKYKPIIKYRYSDIKEMMDQVYPLISPLNQLKLIDMYLMIIVIQIILQVLMKPHQKLFKMPKTKKIDQKNNKINYYRLLIIILKMFSQLNSKVMLFLILLVPTQILGKVNILLNLLILCISLKSKKIKKDLQSSLLLLISKIIKEKSLLEKLINLMLYSL